MLLRAFLALFLLAGLAGDARALTYNFTETFSANASGWRDITNATPSTLTWLGAGGQDGAGYVTTSFNFVNSTAGGQGPVLFRGPGSASGGAFVGNWLNGVTELTAWVRHDAPVPVNFFARFAGPLNFPGATAVQFAPIVSIPGPAGWQQLVFDIDPTNPQFVSFEGTDFNTVFQSIGILQIGVSVPAALAGTDASYSFSLDSIQVVPEPGTLGLAALGIAGAAFVSRLRARADA